MRVGRELRAEPVLAARTPLRVGRRRLMALRADFNADRGHQSLLSRANLDSSALRLEARRINGAFGVSIPSIPIRFDSKAAQVSIAAIPILEARCSLIVHRTAEVRAGFGGAAVESHLRWTTPSERAYS